MSDRRDGRRDDQKDFPEWLTELKDGDDESRELGAAEHENQKGWRFEEFPDDKRLERDRGRSDRYDLE